MTTTPHIRNYPLTQATGRYVVTGVITTRNTITGTEAHGEFCFEFDRELDAIEYAAVLRERGHVATARRVYSAPRLGGSGFPQDLTKTANDDRQCFRI